MHTDRASHPKPFKTLLLLCVLDPFGGVGSTAKACALEHRICTSIELLNELAIQGLEEEVKIGSSKEHTFLQGNSIDILPTSTY